MPPTFLANKELSSFYDQMRVPEQSLGDHKIKHFTSKTGLISIYCEKFNSDSLTARCRIEIFKGRTSYSYSDITHYFQEHKAKVFMTSPEATELEGIFPQNRFGYFDFKIKTYCGVVLPCGSINLEVSGYFMDRVTIENRTQ
ncbi:MAG: hypothetical protein ACK5V3_12130 [Bdellovibrionales bacterium]